jgi:hypothetical protein
VATELLAEETLTLAEVHHIAISLDVARHAKMRSPRLPGQVRATNPVVCMEPTAAGLADIGGGADPVGAVRPPSAAAANKPLALVSALLPWRRRRSAKRVIAEE